MHSLKRKKQTLLFLIWQVNVHLVWKTKHSDYRNQPLVRLKYTEAEGQKHNFLWFQQLIFLTCFNFNGSTLRDSWDLIMKMLRYWEFRLPQASAQSGLTHSASSTRAALRLVRWSLSFQGWPGREKSITLPMLIPAWHPHKQATSFINTPFSQLWGSTMQKNSTDISTARSQLTNVLKLHCRAW